MKNILVPAILLISSVISAQTDSSMVKFSGYAETYYTFDANQPDNHTRPAFITSHNRHNEVNLNLGFLKATYNTHNVRGNIALGAGTYMNANYTSEPGVLKNVFEANAGVKLCKTMNLWMDAGILPSHIGFETAISKDAWNVTRSIVAENTPYYESGVKFSFTSNDSKLLLSVMLLNGWQHIQRPDGNNTPAGGHQLTYKPNDRITLNYSSFIGNEFNDNVGRVRYYHNFYAILQLHKAVGLTAGFDYGAQQVARGSSDYHSWYAPVAILKLTPVDRLSLVGRMEYFHDENGVIIPTGTPNGFQTYGYSASVDYEISLNTLWRIEGRAFESEDQIFILDDAPDRQNYFVTSSLAISF